MFDVAVVGSVNLDLVATTHRLPGPGETVSGTGYAEHAGGKGLNQAVAAARSGASVALIAAVGDDDAGRQLRALAEAEGIDVSGVAVVDGPTGRALITVDERAENSIVVVPGANAFVLVESPLDARIVIAQLEIPDRHGDRRLPLCPKPRRTHDPQPCAGAISARRVARAL